MAARVEAIKPTSTGSTKKTQSKQIRNTNKKVLDELSQNGNSTKKSSSGKRSNQDQQSRSKQQQPSKKVCINEAFVNRVTSYPTTTTGNSEEKEATNTTNIDSMDQTSCTTRILVEDTTTSANGNHPTIAGVGGDTTSSAISSPATFADFVLGRDSTGQSDGDLFIHNFNFAVVDKSKLLNPFLLLFKNYKNLRFFFQVSQMDVPTDGDMIHQDKQVIKRFVRLKLRFAFISGIDTFFKYFF